MIVKKEELMILIEQEETIKKLEEQINRTLRERFVKGGKVKVLLNETFSDQVLDEIQRRYGDGGWKVIWGSDQIDDQAWLEFS